MYMDNGNGKSRELIWILSAEERKANDPVFAEISWVQTDRHKCAQMKAGRYSDFVPNGSNRFL